MDKGTIVVTIVFIAIVTIPVILSGYAKQRKKKLLLHKINELADQKDCFITSHEFCSNFVIGFDEMAGFLFFYKKNENREISHSISIREFRNCRVLSSTREVSGNKDHSVIINKLELCFYPLVKTRQEEIIEFYNNEYDSLSLSGELQLIEKWEKMINERLKKKHHSMETAGAFS